MCAKININLKDGFIDAEGSEEFVKYVYNDIKDKLFSGSNKIIVGIDNRNINKKESEDVNDGNDRKPTKKLIKQPSIVTDLNLKPKENIALQDFYKKKKVANNNFERNLLFAYYLKNILLIETISINHIFTCYREIKDFKTPNNLYQSLIDTKNRKGWIDSSNINDIQVTIAGINFVEHDMEHKKDENQS